MLTFPGHPVGIATRAQGVRPPSDPGAIALIAAMSVAPSAARASVYDTTFARLRNAGLLSKLDWLYVLSAHDEQAAGLDWKSPTRSLTKSGAPTFTADYGFSYDGVDDYHDTNFNPTNDPLATGTQNDNHIGVFVLNNVGSNSAVGNPKQSIQPRAAAGVNEYLGRAANTSNTKISNNSDSRGHYVITRPDSSNITGYLNGALVATVAVASAALDNSTHWIGARRLNNFSSYQIAFAHGGVHLTAQEVSDLYSILAGFPA